MERRLQTAVIAASLLFAACAATPSVGSPTAPASTTPIPPTAATVASTAPPTSPTTTPTVAPTASSAPVSASPEPSASPWVVAGVLPTGRIVFDRNDVSAGFEGPYLGTFVLGPDGVEHRVPIERDVEVLTAVWSPDGRRLLIGLYGPPGRAATIEPDGTRLTVLQPGSLGADVDIGCNSWSHDGSTLLCSVGGGQAHPDVDGMYTMPSAGGMPKRLTVSPDHDTLGTSGECGGGDSHGDLSPDGGRIVFERTHCSDDTVDPGRGQTGALFVANADGSGLRTLVDFGRVHSHGDANVRWSPDGRSIAFGTADGHLALVDPESGAVTELPIVPSSAGDFFAFAPNWSPDGHWIVFSMWLASRASTDLYIADPNGTRVTRITDGDGSEDFASWGP